MQITYQRLQKIPDFQSVPESQLQWLLDHSECKTFKQGENLFSKGDPIDTLYVLLEGLVEIKIERNGHYKTITKMGSNEIGGLLPFSRASSALGIGEVLEDLQILMLNGSYFREMISNHYELTESLVHKMTSRVREFTKDNTQEEKMMALGKLSAGLAHELNNPASAMLRSAKSLKKHLANVPEKFKRIISIRASEEEVDIINKVVFSKINDRPENNMKLSERNEKEDELEEWLEDHGVENAFEYTDTLLDFCMDIPALQEIHQATGDKNLPHAIEWIENVLTTEKMVDEIEEASERVSTLVQSVKSYTHMDRAPEKTATDIHTGIKSTLTMLTHKLKKKNTQLEKDFTENLKHPKIFVSEMNQVWTNLIDNAIDAIEPSGQLKIKTYEDQNSVYVEIIDNGKGIPEEEINLIFDPFFTTKPIGEGTGMGLEVVKRIIDKHEGSIDVVSNKGETKFTVQLPIK